MTRDTKTSKKKINQVEKLNDMMIYFFQPDYFNKIYQIDRILEIINHSCFAMSQHLRSRKSFNPIKTDGWVGLQSVKSILERLAFCL